MNLSIKFVSGAEQRGIQKNKAESKFFH